MLFGAMDELPSGASVASRHPDIGPVIDAPPRSRTCHSISRMHARQGRFASGDLMRRRNGHFIGPRRDSGVSGIEALSARCSGPILPFCPPLSARPTRIDKVVDAVEQQAVRA